MRLPFGFTLTRPSRQRQQKENFVTSWPGTSVSGFWPMIRESFAGAWQRGVVVPVEDVAAHPTFWSCITLIAGDIAKCRPMLVEKHDDICEETENSAYSPVVRKPNEYQNHIQFYEYWMLGKLLRGNAYALKSRDGRGGVDGLYLLDPCRTRPMITPRGDVYYALGQDELSGVTEASIVVPAREIIHDRWNTLYHPLCGLSPVYACGASAVQGMTINQNATRLFRNGSQIGGILTAPGPISQETADKLERHWAENYSGEKNIGRIPVLGGGLKFDQPPVMSAVDSQLIEQLKWDDEKICATLHVPPYKVGVGPLPSYNNVEALGQDYYGQALQIHFEAIELCLTEGLELKTGYAVEFDLATLDRMDSVQRMDVATKGVTGGIFSPNEARVRFNLPAVPGGDTVYLQRQNWPLEKLGSDEPKATPMPEPPAPVAAPEPRAVEGLSVAELEAETIKTFRDLWAA